MPDLPWSHGAEPNASASPVARWPAASACRWPPSSPCDCARCPSPLYTVLLGYKESSVAEARLRYGAMVRRAPDRVPAPPRRPASRAGGRGGRSVSALARPLDAPAGGHRPLGPGGRPRTGRCRRTARRPLGSGTAAEGRGSGRAATRRAYAARRGGVRRAPGGPDRRDRLPRGAARRHLRQWRPRSRARPRHCNGPERAPR